MISRKYKCIFIEVPKTGSTSIRSILGHPPKAHLDLKEIAEYSQLRYPYMDCWGYKYIDKIYSMLATDRIKKSNATAVMTSYFRFGFVRNPWSRTVSLYLRRQGIQMRDKLSFEEFVDWIQYSSDTCKHPSQKLNQLDWFKNSEGDIDVDFIGRFESLEEDWNHISNRLGISMKLPHLNANPTDRKHYSEYYSKGTKEIIRTKFIQDIEYFNYSFD